MSGISPLAALAGGMLTILAPCSVMVLPAFFSYAFQSKRALLARTGLFWAGLLLALVPLGAAFGASGAFLAERLGFFARLTALLVILLGVLEAAAIELPRPRRRARPGRASRDLTSPGAVLLLGAGYGLAGIGCAGPILGAILVTAGFGASPWQGALLMVLYATGMAVPLGLLALVWRAGRLSERAWLRPRPLRVFGRESTWTNLVSGLLLIGLGIALGWSGASNPLGGAVPASRLASWEESVLRLASSVPAWALLFAIVAAAGALWFAWPCRAADAGHTDAGHSTDAVRSADAGSAVDTGRESGAE